MYGYNVDATQIMENHMGQTMKTDLGTTFHGVILGINLNPI